MEIVSYGERVVLTLRGPFEKKMIKVSITDCVASEAGGKVKFIHASVDTNSYVVSSVLKTSHANFRAPGK